MSKKDIRKYCNHIGYSDIEPYQVVRYISDTTVEVRGMDFVPDPDFKPQFISRGFSAVCQNQNEQKWIITSSSSAIPFRVRYSKSKDRWQDKNGCEFRMSDKPVKFFDYNF